MRHLTVTVSCGDHFRNFGLWEHEGGTNLSSVVDAKAGERCPVCDEIVGPGAGRLHFYNADGTQFIGTLSDVERLLFSLPEKTLT